MLEDKIFHLCDRKAGILGSETAFKSSVLVPLTRIDDEWCLLFQKRSSSIDRQPGEICFPGGALEESDPGPRYAAIREGCEELGLSPDDISVIADLDVFVSPFNMIIRPYLAIIHHPEKIVIDPIEVASVFYVPLQWLLTHQPLETSNGIAMTWPEDFPVHLIPQGKNYPYRRTVYPQYFYLWKEEVIWGLTARILTHFLDLIR